MSDILLIDNSHPAISVLTLNRPDKRNALNVELIQSLDQEIQAAARDPNRGGIILRGAGDVFCAGLDLCEATDPATAHRSAEALAMLYRNLYHSRLVTIAATHGAAFGGGAGLIAACDFAILADEIRLGYPEVHRGLVPALVTCLLRRQLRGRDLRELLILGKTVAAAEAVQIGLANRVVPATDLLDAAMEIAEAACAGAAGAIARTKALLASLDPIDRDIESALQFHLESRNSPEAREGMAAFLEKRAPRWERTSQ